MANEGRVLTVTQEQPPAPVVAVYLQNGEWGLQTGLGPAETIGLLSQVILALSIKLAEPKSQLVVPRVN